MDEAAIEDARRNASSNGIANASFETADLAGDWPAALTELRPDVVIVGAMTVSPLATHVAASAWRTYGLATAHV